MQTPSTEHQAQTLDVVEPHGAENVDEETEMTSRIPPYNKLLSEMARRVGWRSKIAARVGVMKYRTIPFSSLCYVGVGPASVERQACQSSSRLIFDDRGAACQAEFARASVPPNGARQQRIWASYRRIGVSDDGGNSSVRHVTSHHHQQKTRFSADRVA